MLSLKMRTLILLALFLGLAELNSSQELPTVYEYFTEGGISSGLVAGNNEFRLNGKYIRFISGGMHYFRMHPAQWRDRLRKLRAIGANAIETYVPWNMHEPRMGEFDYGNGTNDFSAFMDIRGFLQIAQEEDLLVILRPGPYVCTEWDFGGLPSWLLRDPEMRVRENYQPFLDRTKIFFDSLLSQIEDLQFTRGGSIVAIQIENEYANFNPRSREYLEFIRDSFTSNRFNESLYFTADNSGWINYDGAIPGILQTLNTHQPDGSFPQVLQVQPDMPLFAMEYYTGWFNHWGDEKKGTRDTADYMENLEKIFGKYNGSANLYMFFGGTSFGFMAGANSKGEAPFIDLDTSSYDYDALISEAGDYTEKYFLTKDLVELYESPKLWKPEMPTESLKTAYPTLQLQEVLNYEAIVAQIPGDKRVVSEKTLSMEQLDINNGNGQSYGYVIYRKSGNFSLGDSYKVSWPRDFAQLIIDGVQVESGYNNDNKEYWINSVKDFPLSLSTDQSHTIDLIVENMGRINHGQDSQFRGQKGLAAVHEGKIELNGVEIQDIEIIAAEFSTSWVMNLTNWRPVGPAISTPCLLRTSFVINEEPMDTWLDMRQWHKGIVFVNGFNIGRYWKIGPQETLYVPAPLLKQGENEILIYEQLEVGPNVRFTDTPILG